jgi:hypothetical protein
MKEEDRRMAWKMLFLMRRRDEKEQSKRRRDTRMKETHGYSITIEASLVSSCNGEENSP